MDNFVPFSKKQMKALAWWSKSSPYSARDALICDGAVRSGKTLCMTLSFVLWSFSAFEQASFALCGKTIASLRRNVVDPLLPLLRSMGFHPHLAVSRNQMELSIGKHTNRFYLFGGRDESSAGLIQGMTLSGVLFDEVALMPRSFVEQALARCSVAGSKFWFNCNPQTPGHWFYKEWICQAKSKNALYLHFTMADNPSLSPAIRKRYQGLYTGAFYQRFIEGKWVAAQGLVYPMFSPERHIAPPPSHCESYYISCDYGTVNPCSMGLWGKTGSGWHRLAEYYHDSRREGVQKTDEEYYQALETLAGGRTVEGVIIDPSAASFMACIRRHGRFRVIPARNDVLYGIGRVGDALRADQLHFSPECRDILREFTLYRWEENREKDAPRKEFDHAMDDLRYFAVTLLDEPEEPLIAIALERKAQNGGRK